MQEDSTNSIKQLSEDDTVTAENTDKNASLKKSIPFLIVLCTITVLAWLIPIRPTFSNSENRSLQEFPDFSFNTLITGEYFTSIETWFSDTFTFREDWVTEFNDFRSLYGIGSVAVYGDIPVVDEVPVVPDTSEQIDDSEFVPFDYSAEIENEPVKTENSEIQIETAEIPESSDAEESNIITELEDADLSYEDFSIDEEQFTYSEGSILIGDALYGYPGFNKYYAELYAQTVNDAASALEGKANLYCVIAPRSVSIMLSEEEREQYEIVPEEDTIAYVYSLMSGQVGKVNSLKYLQQHNDEYLAFRSDPHWTALAAYYAYEVWCRIANKEAVSLSEYDEYAWDGFLGTLYSGCGQPKAVRDNPDTVYAYMPKGNVHLYINAGNGNNLGQEYSLLLDRSQCGANGKYMTFLWGDHPLSTFVNDDIDDNSACLLIKTSFGNPFAYYLTQHYHTVYVIDMRYYSTSKIPDFVDEFGVNDVIILHASDLCYGSNGCALLKSLFGLK